MSLDLSNAPVKATPTPRSVATATPKRTTSSAAIPYAGYQSSAEQAAEVAKLVAAAQLPQKQSLQAQAAADRGLADAQAQTTQGYYTALAKILEGAAPQVQQGYSTAGANDAAFSKGFSDGLSHVQDKMGAQDQSVLNVAGAPAGQAADVAAAGGGTGLQDALYNTGYQPAVGLQSQGAAAVAAAAQLPATAGLLGGQAISKINQTESANQGVFNQKLADLAAQIPGLRMNLQNQLAGQQSDLQKNAAQLANYKSEADARDATIKRNAAKDKVDAAYKMAVLTGVGPDGKPTAATLKTLATLTGTLADGSPTLAAQKAAAQIAQGAARINISQQNADTSRFNSLKTKPAATNPGGSQWRALVSDATKQAGALATGKPDKVQLVKGKPVTVTGTGKAPADYADAYDQIVTLGPDTPAWHRKAADIVNAKYGPKIPSLIADTVESAIAQGYSYADAAKLLKQDSTLPQGQLQAALKSGYKKAATQKANTAAFVRSITPSFGG